MHQPHLQHDALAAASCYKVFTDTASGALASRPELGKLLDQLRPNGTVVVWRLERLGRSIRHLIDQMTELQERGIEFRSLQENIDTGSSGGRLVFHIFASLAEFERDLISEPTHAGLEAARARGRVGGRPPLLSGDKLRTARKFYEQQDMTVAQIGGVLGAAAPPCTERSNVGPTSRPHADRSRRRRSHERGRGTSRFDRCPYWREDCGGAIADCQTRRRLGA